MVRKRETVWIIGSTKISKYVLHSIYETITRIDAYLNSKHIMGSTDSLNREKPFYNIVIAATNIWQRATDIDRKDIRIKALKKADEVKAFLAMCHLQLWMRKVNFGVFLNEWGRTLAAYGSAITKFVEKDGQLYPSVIPWNKVIVDAIDFENNPVIEKLYYTPGQLLENKSYDQKEVKRLIEYVRQPRKLTDKQQVDILSDYIEVFEVHGNLPLSYLTNKDKDKDIYQQQMHVLCYYVRNDKKGEYEDFSLFKGREAESPYILTHLDRADGRTLSVGCVERLFESQWMTNHAAKSMKDTLDLTSKVLFQTSDANYLGRNALSAIETGDILIYKDNMPLTQINNSKQDIAALEQYMGKWEQIGQELTNTPNAMRGMIGSGTGMPSQSSYRMASLVIQQTNQLFDLYTENKGLSVEEMMRKKVIPHLEKKLNNADEIAIELEANDLTKIDSIYLPVEAVKRYNKRMVQQVIQNGNEVAKGNVASPLQPFNMATEQQPIQQELNQQGNTRYFTTDDIKKIQWSKFFKDFEWECEVEVTNETVDKNSVLSTLSSLLQTAVNNPPLYKMITEKILEETGVISPLEVAAAQAQQPPPQPQPSPLQPQQPNQPHTVPVAGG